MVMIVLGGVEIQYEFSSSLACGIRGTTFRRLIRTSQQSQNHVRALA